MRHGEYLLYPSIAVNRDGVGALAFNLVGPDHFPSFAYVDVEHNGVGSIVHVVAEGGAPEDGFSGCGPYGGNGTARWGDYSASTIAPDGTVWIAGEYIPGRERTQLANWGTFIARVK